MKRIKYFLLVAISLFLIQKASAQHVGHITKFEILPAYLTSDGKVKISDGATTSVKYKVSFARQLSDTGPVGSYKPFNMAVMLSTSAPDNSVVVLGESNKVTSVSFESNSSFLLDQEFTATIDNTKLTKGKTILLAYVINDTTFPVLSYEGKSYQIELPSSPTDPNPSTGQVPLSPVFRLKSENGGEYLDANPTGIPPLRGYEIAFYVGGSNLSTFFELVHKNTNGNPDEYTYRAGSFNSSLEPYWEFRGDAFRANVYNDGNTVPVYELKNKFNNNRRYTTDINDINRDGYESQGVAFYAYPVPVNTVPPRAETPRPPREPGGPTRPPRG